jgi:hypothetical protein
MKAEDIYEIFNSIQTGSNTNENLENLLMHFEKDKDKEHFIKHLENVFLIIIKNYEKNNIALKNIKDLIQDFLEKITRNQKQKEGAKKLLNHFCQLFSSHARKQKFKIICIYFLSMSLFNLRCVFEPILQ